jgi:hypothetical protein
MNAAFFRRNLAKTEVFGNSLMDVGVGSVVYSLALSSSLRKKRGIKLFSLLVSF